MEAILDHLRRWAPPNAPDVVPAYLHAIEDIEEASGAPLTQAHFQFLWTMGKSTGALRVDQAKLDVGTVQECYALGRWTPPAPLVWLGLDEDPLQELHYFLDRSRPVGEDDCAVVRFSLDQHGRAHDWEDRAQVAYRTLREMLMVWLMRGLRLPQLEYLHVLVARRRTPPFGEVERACDAWFGPALPHFQCNLGFDAPNGAALIVRDPEDREVHTVYLGGAAPQPLAERVALLLDLGLEDRTPAPVDE